MKNRIKLMLVALVLSFSINAKASDGWEVTVDSSQTLVVEINKNLQKASLTIQDEQGNIFFKDGLMDTMSYRKSLNLKELPEGTYYVKFENGYNIFTEVVVKSQEGLQLKEGTRKVLFKPSFRLDEKKLRVLFTNPEEKFTRLEICDASGEIVGLVKSSSATIQKTLDFSQVPAGNYFVRIKSGDETFKNEFYIN